MHVWVRCSLVRNTDEQLRAREWNDTLVCSIYNAQN